jgi:hypothetical protein
VGLSTPANDAQHVFKFVTGVLNSAFSVEEQVHECLNSMKRWCPRASATFSDACDALSSAIGDKLIPQNSIDILVVLCANTSMDVGSKLNGVLNQGRTEGDAEHLDDEASSESEDDTVAPVIAQPTDVVADAPKPTQTKANKLFQQVTSILRGETSESIENFELICNELALSIKGREVPKQGIDALLQYWEHIETGSDLAEALLSFLCPQCESNKPRCNTCDSCKGSFKALCRKCSGTGRHSQPCMVAMAREEATPNPNALVAVVLD